MRRSVRVGLGVGAVVALYVSAQAIRVAGLRRRGAELVAKAQGFPRSYPLEGSGTFVALGDSTALGVGAHRVEETLPYRVGAGRVVNLGVSGAGALDVLAQLPNLPEGPIERALVSVTANDATRGTSPSDVEDDLAAILETLKARGVGRVVVTATPSFVGTPALPWPTGWVLVPRARDLAATVRKVAARYAFVRVADLNRLGTLEPDEYAADGFHPNAKGYARWAAIIGASFQVK